MARLHTLLAAAALAGAAAQSICAGGVNISVDGVTETWQVVSAQTADGLISGSGDTISLKYGPRGYLVPSCTDSFEPGMYKGMPLMGKSLTYTVDLSTVGCACNAALYFTQMPGYNQQQQPDATTCGDYYCDANSVCGVWCPEVDVMEANNAAFQATPHKCDAPTGKYYPSCDRSGCGVNSYRVNPTGYGPGSSYVINTLLPFNVSTLFQDQGTGQLTSLTTLLTQGGRNLTLAHTDSNCGSGYLEALSDSVNAGLTMIWSLWGDAGSTMSWLDVPPCSTSVSCDKDNAAFTISSITISSL